MKSFTISNRTRKGCPLSLCFFNLMIEPLVEAIRSHLDITGFYFHNSVNLFEDDTILLLTNPESSLPLVFQILSQFSCISYYKVNASKALILDLAVQASTKLTLQCQFPLRGTQKGSYTWALLLLPFLPPWQLTILNPWSPKLKRNSNAWKRLKYPGVADFRQWRFFPFLFNIFIQKVQNQNFPL